MSELARLCEPLGERAVAASDLPLSIGGAGAAIVVPGSAPGSVLAHLGADDGRIFLQPDGDVTSVEGKALRSSIWLTPGMRVQLARASLIVMPGNPPVLLLQHDVDNATRPPDIALPARADGEDADRIDLTRIAFTRPEAGPMTAQAARKSRAGTWAALAGLLVAAIGVFVLGSRALGLRVSTDPADARVAVRGGLLHPRFAGRIWLMPGDYRVSVTRAGYAAAQRDVTLRAGAPLDLQVRLEKLPGEVELQHLPPDSSVFWDDKGFSGKVQTLSAGVHRLRIEAPHYEIFDSTVDVEGRGRHQVVTPALIARWAVVRITSDPSGASVSVDGKPVGATPGEFKLDAGLRSINLQAAGTRSWNGSILVHSGENQSLGPIRLGLPDAALSVVSMPNGADVTVSGQYRGRTPLKIALAPGLDYEVAVQAPGFVPASRRADLRNASSARIDVKLAAVLGEVTVKGDPGDAQVFANGRELGAAGGTFRLPAAIAAIEVRKAGFDPFSTSITPKPEFPQLVEYQLVPAGASAKPVLPDALKSSIGLELKLMPAGEYEMGSNRREPGRRANEVQHRVRLKRRYYLSTTEINNQQFRRFRDAHSSGIYRSKTLDLDNQPVVNVTWGDAVEFCNWLSGKESLPEAYVKSDGGWKLVTPVNTGYRLPTEAEWEFAARYDGRAPTLRYPWGTGLPIAPISGNFADTSARMTLDAVLEGYSDGYVVTAPSGQFQANAVGLFDMGGNVSEWINDIYTTAPQDSADVLEDPLGPAQGGSHVVRGSNYRSATISELRLAYRDSASEARVDLGFRVARYAPP